MTRDAAFVPFLIVHLLLLLLFHTGIACLPFFFLNRGQIIVSSTSGSSHRKLANSGTKIVVYQGFQFGVQWVLLLLLL